MRSFAGIKLTARGNQSMSSAVGYPITEAGLRWLEGILSERYGCSCRLSQENEGIYLRLLGSCKSILFDNQAESFIQSNSSVPYTTWEAHREGWESFISGSVPAPGISKLPCPLIEIADDKARFHYDVLGLTYWMLNRIEEIGRTDLDEHSRFPACSSHAFKHGYLNRPVVDEWLFILAGVMRLIWPGASFYNHAFKIRLSHDVDRPSRYALCSRLGFLRSAIGDFSRNRRIGDIAQAVSIRARSEVILDPRDPFNTFKWMMDEADRRGISSSFFFLCGTTDRAKDGDYDIEHPAMLTLIRGIAERGHEIGVHPSYGSCTQASIIKSESDRLWSILEREQIHQNQFGGRMHYLRWKHPETLHALAASILTYDNTLGYADHPGFRCGTCFEYTAFDPVTSNILPLRLIPLIVMDQTFLSKKYNKNFATDELDEMAELKQTCKKAGGVFSLLWHNNHLVDPRHRRFFSEIIEL